MWKLSAVESIKQRKMTTEMRVIISINPVDAVLFAACAYSTEAMARIVTGKEYAHHATLNFFMAFLNRPGLQICFMLDNLCRLWLRLNFKLINSFLLNLDFEVENLF